MKRYRRTYLEVDLSAIRLNVRQHRQYLNAGDSMMAVVKANGYGHGSVQVLKAAIGAGVDWAGISSVEEAIVLREAGVKIPIMLLGAWYPEAIPAFQEFNITPGVYSIETADLLFEYAAKLNIAQEVHLKLDTGMGRLGFSMEQLSAFLVDPKYAGVLEVTGVYSHFSSADETEPQYSLKQVELFREMQEKIVDFYHSIKWVHIANSAGTSLINQDRGNLFRLGIAMYGQPPSPNHPGSPELQEAITWKTSISQLKIFPKGSPISYGRTFVTSNEMKIATLAVGYADGYSRLLSNKAEVLVNGKRAKVVGRVCMDMIMVDVSEIEDVRLHDEVVLIGKQGEEYISATELADIIGTINYEVVCNISSRVPRVYLN